MLQVKYFPFELPFEYPFTISKGTKTHQPTLIVSLGMGNITGYGEATAIAYYNVTIDGMIELLESKKQGIERYALTDPQRFWHFLHHLLPGNNFLIAALDIAGWDLFARMRRTPLKKLLGIPVRPGPLTDYTIGIDTIEKMVEKLEAHPWPVYKIKLRSADDIDMLEALRAKTDAPFRVDANEAFSFEEAERMLPEFARLGVTLVEQPLAKAAWEEMKELKLKSPIPLFADESCVEERDVAKCQNSFHGINIKLAKCGGITPAIRMITEARKLGLKIMMGSMNESTIGTAAVAHLMPVLDEVDADGPLLLKEDVGAGLRYDKGSIYTNDLPGLGTSFWGEQRENKNLSSVQ
jgi:L-alanine-DL-glutamate epimerase-like enolase superfamily enzyme